MQIWKWALAVPFAFISAPAFSSDLVALSNIKAGMLAEMCRRDSNPLELDPCNSFIMGATDGLQFGRSICIKDTSGYSYVAIGVVKKHLVDHPESYGKPAIVVVEEALRAKFPC